MLMESHPAGYLVVHLGCRVVHSFVELAILNRNTATQVLPVVMRDCIPRESCPTHDTEAAMLEQPCAPGYQGHGCSQCADDHTRFFGRCNTCSGASVGMFVAGLLGYSAFYIGACPDPTSDPQPSCYGAHNPTLILSLRLGLTPTQMRRS
jgi:hypothetical protein